ncbi:LacI family DNA-binding transcriptional regulator [Jiella sp. M17.18]|uniref:LacI family DNA-binding transcriptional regulator n=1 Tax=Jiella sp. M17.18 TaxID=3234247 RepID=UPI0034DF4B5D
MANDQTRPPPAGPSFVSAQQVADRAGVSRSAVSRAFTPGASIGRETRERVIKAAEELGYQVNDLARGLLARQSRLVGLVGTRPDLGFRAHLVAALAKALIARGSVPVLINTGDTPQEVAAAQGILLGYRAEATIVISGSPPAPMLEGARRNGQPVILIGRTEPDLDGVLADNAAAGDEAAERLLALSAGGPVGLIGARSGTQSIAEREDAFRRAVGRRGGDVIFAQGAEADYAGGQEAARTLFAEARPKALYAVNDLLAMGAMDHARLGLGLTIPGDLAVIGFDDVPQAGWEAYALTTFQQDPETMAAQAIALLVRRQADPAAPPLTLRVPARLVPRRSARSGHPMLEGDRS